MFRKLEEVELRFSEIQAKLERPGVANDRATYLSLMREYSDLEPLVVSFREYRKVSEEINSHRVLLDTEKDEELKDLAREELKQFEGEQNDLEQKLKVLLLPKDPNDHRDVILEIRAGAGGDEASLFAEELFRAYSNYASQFGWSVKILSVSEGNVGGVKEIIGSFSGEKVFSRLKHESGVHRVQRVPKTETQGRVHTSTVTVAVIPEVDEVEVSVNPQEIRIDVCRASGSGGQSVNTTDSAVRVTHLPTGLIVYCQEGKSQHSNKDQALRILYARLKAMEDEKARKEASETRLSQIGTGDRSERIRTYNFPQSRATDHRIGLTVHNLSEIMKGELDGVVEPLIAYYQAEALKNQQRGVV